MRIAAVGRAFEGATDNFQFSSTQSFLDYDLLVLDLGHAKHEYNTSLTSPVYQGLPSLNDTSSAAIRRDIPRRKSEILDMLKLGRTVVVFTPASQAVFAATGETQYSGTGKNSRATRIVSTIDLLAVLPVAVHTVEASGESIEFRGQEPFNNFWASQGRFLFYEAYFQVPIGNGLFYIKGTNRVVGAYMSMEKGNLLFLPSFAYDQFFKTTKDYQNA